MAVATLRNAVADLLWAAALCLGAFFADDAVGLPASAGRWERWGPALVAAVVFMVVRRMGTLQVGEPDLRRLARDAFCHLIVLAAAVLALVDVPGSLWQRYVPVAVAVELARRLRRRAGRARGGLRTPTQTGFRPSRRALLTWRGLVALQNVRAADTSVRGWTTNIADTEFDSVAERFRKRGDLVSAAWATARGIEYMVDQNRLTEAETRSTAAMRDPELAAMPAVLGARALFLAVVGLQADGLALLARAAAHAERTPPELGALLASFAHRAAAPAPAPGDWRWNERRRFALVWRGDVAAVVLGLADDLADDAGDHAAAGRTVSPEDRLSALYRVCGLPDEVTGALNAETTLGDYQRLATARGLALLAAAHLHQDGGDLLSAMSAYLDAYKDFEFVRDRARAGECLVRAYGLAASAGAGTLVRENHVLDMLRVGLQVLEEDRGVLRGEGHRSGWLRARTELYGSVFDLLAGGFRSRPAKAGELGLWLLESLHRTMTGQVLRDAGGLRTDPALLAALEQLRLAEGAAGMSAKDAQGSPDPDDVSALRATVAGRLAHWREAGAITEPVDTDDLLRRLGGRTAIVYRCRRDAGGWHVQAVLVSAAHGVRIHRCDVPEDPADQESARFLTAAGALDVAADGPPGDVRSLFHVPLDDPLWQQLGQALLPPAWWDVLCPEGGRVELLVVPDGPVAGLPLAALPVRDGRCLLEFASVALVPALALLAEPAPAAPVVRPVVVTHLDTALAGTAPEAAQWQRVRGQVVLRDTSDRESLLAALADAPPADVVMISTHGSAARAFDRTLRLRDGSVLSAAAALGMGWPGTVILGSCWVNAMEVAAGREPFGFPLACLLGGAHTVIGGMAPVDDRTTGATLAAFVRAVPERRPDAEMAREAAQEVLRTAPDPGELSPVHLAGLAVWTTAAAPSPQGSGTYRSHWERNGTPREEQPAGVLVPAVALGQALEHVLVRAAATGAEPLDTAAFVAAAFPRDPRWRFLIAGGEQGAEVAEFGAVALDTARGTVLLSTPLAQSLTRGLRLAEALGQPAAPGHVAYGLLFDEDTVVGRRAVSAPASRVDQVLKGLTRDMSWPDPPDPALLLGDEDGQGRGDGDGGGDHDERLAAVSRDDAYWEQRSRTARTPWKVPLGAALLVLLLPRAGGLLSPAPAAAARTGEVGVVLEDTTGHQVEVTAVLPGEPAARSGLRAGDIVTAVDGVRPADAAQAVSRIRGSAPGRRMTLELLRADAPLKVTLTVAEPEPAHPEGSLGAGLRDAESGGPQVTTVTAGSPAAAVHLAPGDQVLAVDGSPAQSAAGFVALVHAHRPGDRVTLTVLRGGSRYEVTATLARL